MNDISYKNFLKTEYPSAYNFLESRSSEPLFFSDSVPLSTQIYKQMSTVVKTLFQLKKTKNYQESLSTKSPEAAFKNQKQDSVLMAYDFHIAEEKAKLIEVNTNASAFLLVNSLYQFRNLPYKKAKEDLKKSFQTEWKKFKSGKEAEQKNTTPKKIVLIDESPLSQKMAVEFFMYKDFFQTTGWPAEICESQSLKLDDNNHLYTSGGDKIDFVYNRSTDFYFEHHPHLEKAYFNHTCAVSPNPREYYLLSDKKRLCDWSAQKDQWAELKQIESHLPFSEVLSLKNKDRIWKNRKKYFFKILRGHGGKLAYRGSGLTRKKFDELCETESLVQEYIPPSTIKDFKGKEWKVDFRAYVYEDQIQQLTARVYQGQLTNFRQEGSGFSTVALC